MSSADQFVFLDVETRSKVPVTVGGARRHCKAGRVTILAYAVGTGPVRDWTLEDWRPGRKLDWRAAPEDLAAAVAGVRAGRMKLVAWNAGFEFRALSLAMTGWENLRETDLLDAMVQAIRSHLPPDLKSAAKRLGKTQKADSGKTLIRLFSDEGGTATPQTHPAEWAEFRAYARDDVAAMRDVFLSTLPLDTRDWAEYHAVARINERGVPVDAGFVRAAAALADETARRANTETGRLTGGALKSVNQSAAMLAYVREVLAAHPEVERILKREIELVEDEDGETRAVPKYSLDRPRVEELLAWLRRVNEEIGLTDEEAALVELLNVRLYGASATPRKFKRIVDLLDEDGRVRDGYMFNGAPATGRMSGRGVQWQNLARDVIGTAEEEEAAIEIVKRLAPADAYDVLQARFGPVGRTLSRLIRPAVAAPPGKMLVWADWSAIEARILPWIADSVGGNIVVDTFRQNDSDPGAPDIYTITAGRILDKPAEQITRKERQSHGKVPVLALGFGGGTGALFAMARAYGTSFTEDEAWQIVERWRRENNWAVRLWQDLQEAATWCMRAPGQPRKVGRVLYSFDSRYLGGTLFCILPDGRVLCYPSLRFDEVEQKDRKTGEVYTRRMLTTLHGRERRVLTHLTLCNNIVQGTAASLLRAALVRLDGHPLLETVLTTHDEIVCLCDEHHADEAAEALLSEMLKVPEWAEGLPLKAEVSRGRRYSKTAE